MIHITKMKCKECGYELNEYGVCENCGLLDDELEGEYQDEDIYPYDEEELTHYGDPRGQGVSNIAVMTKVNLAECENPDLKRALRWDTNYEWDIVKTEIINKSIKETCKKLGLNKAFRENAFYFFRKIKNKDSTFGKLAPDLKLTGKLLEDIGVALVYLIIRLDGCWNLTLWDFEKLGYNVKKIYKYYVFFLKELNLYRLVKPQNAEFFVSKFINDLIDDDPKTYKFKHELTKYVQKAFLGWLGQIRPATFVDLNNFDGGAGLIAAGACIYKCLKDFKHPEFIVKNLTQSLICDYCGCTEVTLRDYINKIIEFEKQLEKDS